MSRLQAWKKNLVNLWKKKKEKGGVVRYRGDMRGILRSIFLEPGSAQT